MLTFKVTGFFDTRKRDELSRAINLLDKQFNNENTFYYGISGWGNVEIRGSYISKSKKDEDRFIFELNHLIKSFKIKPILIEKE